MVKGLESELDSAYIFSKSSADYGGGEILSLGLVRTRNMVGRFANAKVSSSNGNNS